MLEDFKFAIRALRKAPGFCLVVVTTLALGLGANTAVFGVLHAAILTPLPYPAPDQLVRIYLERDGERRFLSGPSLVDLRAQTRTMNVASVYTYSELNVDLTDRGRPERVPLTLTSANYFDVLGVTPVAGRVFTRDDERANARVAIISTRLWKEYFGGEVAALGRSLTMSGRQVQVVGVLPEGFEDPFQPQVEIWMPENLQPGDANSWGNNRLSAIGRIPDGFTIQDARAEAAVVVARQAPNLGARTPITARVLPLQDDIVGAAGPMLYVLLGAVGLLLLLACVNVASLMLARAAARAQEITVRAALGSSRWRIVRQLLVESMVLSLAGGAAGLFIAYTLSRVLLAAAPVTVLRPEGALDVQVFAYCFAVALAAGLGFGVVPAMQASRPDLEAVLREGGRGGTAGRRGTRIWNTLVVCQVAAALVLLVSAGLLLKSFHRLQQVDLGIDSANVLTFQVSLPEGRYTPEQRRQFHVALHERVAALPGVRATAATSRLPVTGPYHVWGTRLPGTTVWPLLPQQRVIEGAYFETLDIPILRGRAFGPEDHATAERRVVVSESVAQALFPGADAIGRQVQVTGFTATIIGIVPDTVLTARGARAPAVYHSHAQFADNRNWQLTQVISIAGPAAGLVDAVRRELHAIDPQLVLHQPQLLNEVIGGGQARERFSLQLIGAFAVLALVIAGIGLYGVLAYAVTSRRREIGIRMALGAQPSAVRGLFVGMGSRLTLLGLAAGAVGAFAATRALRSLLFEISVTDPVVFVVSASTLAVVAAAAAWIPARAATRVDPLEVLSR